MKRAARGGLKQAMCNSFAWHEAHLRQARITGGTLVSIVLGLGEIKDEQSARMGQKLT